jgi:hypothetical protein
VIVRFVDIGGIVDQSMFKLSLGEIFNSTTTNKLSVFKFESKEKYKVTIHRIPVLSMTIIYS